jgi:hypothetical protein
MTQVSFVKNGDFKVAIIETDNVQVVIVRTEKIA